MRIFQEQETTVKKYGATLIKLVLNIARYGRTEFDLDNDHSHLVRICLMEMESLKAMLNGINDDELPLFIPSPQHIVKVKKIVVSVLLRTYGGGFNRQNDFLFNVWMKLCLNEDAFSFKDPNVCSQYIAHLHYFIRVAVVVFLMNVEEDQDMSRVEKTTKYEFYLGFTKTAAISQTPFSILEQCMRLCATHMNHMDRKENIVWLDQMRNMEMLVGDVLVSPSIFKESIESLYQAAKTKLEHQVLPWFNVEDMERQLNSLHLLDHIDKKTIGYSIQNIDALNNWFMGLQPMIGNNAGYNRFLYQEGNISQLKKYLTQVNEFLVILLTLVHLSSGQPARITELQMLTLYNSENNYRSVYVYDGYIQFVFEYNKTNSITQHTRNIIRYLPKKYNGIFLLYATLVRTIER